jgi:hypothetical protein
LAVDVVAGSNIRGLTNIIVVGKGDVEVCSVWTVDN